MVKILVPLQVCALFVGTIQCSQKKPQVADSNWATSADVESMPSKASSTIPLLQGLQDEVAKAGKEHKIQEIAETDPQQIAIPITEKSIVIYVERLGQTDTLNIRKGNKIGVITVLINTYEYRKEDDIEGSRPVPSPIKVDQTRFVNYDKRLVIDLPLYFSERKLIDIEIPSSLDATVIVDNEIRHKGLLEVPKAWKGFETHEGSIDHLAAKKLSLSVREIHPVFALPLKDYPITGGQNVKIIKKFGLPSPFRGIQSIFVQVDSVTHNPVSVLIPGLAPDNKINQRLLEYLKSWEIIAQESKSGVSGFTTGLRVNKRRGEK